MATTTQEELPIQDIHEDLVSLKDGSYAMVLQAGAVNFDLLSEREQLAIIDSFAGFLNSLSFPVQIVIRSKRLDISSYLAVLQKAQLRQKNPLLAQMMEHYRRFVANTIKENDVLDKQFYIVILASYLELGIIKNSTGNFKKAATILVPRREHIIRQFARIGLRVNQLSTEKLTKLFYDIYNESNDSDQAQQASPEPTLPVVAEPIAATQSPPAAVVPTVPQPVNPTNQPVSPPPPPPTLTVSSSQPPQAAPTQPVAFRTRTTNSSPYVVEELADDYGTV